MRAMRMTATQLEFLERLGRSPEGQQLKAIIAAEIDDVNVQLRAQTGESLYRAQGRAAYLDDLAAKLSASHLVLKRDRPIAPFQRDPG